ncbi:MAG: hypothetical protein ACT4O0_03170 [Pseudonocardia sp.]
MLRKSPVPPVSGSPISDRGRRALWGLALGDMMAVSWMLSAGEVLDRSRLTSVITLGGHHLVVLYLAGAAFVGLAVLAALTCGFTEARQPHLIGIALACTVSVVALAGVISVVGLVAGALLLIGLTGRLLLH